MFEPNCRCSRIRGDETLLILVSDWSCTVALPSDLVMSREIMVSPGVWLEMGCKCECSGIGGSGLVRIMEGAVLGRWRFRIAVGGVSGVGC